MAKCDICGKGQITGNNVPFSLKKTRRVFRPNIQSTTFLEGGRKVKKTVCSRCLRTVTKS